MMQEEKQLLIKDLCARLPYKPMIRLDFQPGHGYQIGEMGIRHFWDIVRHFEDGIITTVKPYLRPMSSMTEKEANECIGISRKIIISKIRNWFDFSITNPIFTDWLNAHHFDYRGLIEKGLALEAPNGMYKTE